MLLWEPRDEVMVWGQKAQAKCWHRRSQPLLGAQAPGKATMVADLVTEAATATGLMAGAATEGQTEAGEDGMLRE